MRNLLFAITIISLYGFSIPPKTAFGTLEITIKPQLSGQPLILTNKLYHSTTGDSLYIDALRFYISAVQLDGKTAVFAENNSYHLIDAEESGSQTIILKNVPVGTYQSLSFYIGTDSLTNVAGALGGDLDPTLGMYWAWNSGYINVKVEGRSNNCPTLYHAFEFHLGGYMPPHQTVRKVVIPLDKMKIVAGKTTFLLVNTDLAKFFNRIQLAMTNKVVIPSKAAAQMADYFQDVFYAK